MRIMDDSIPDCGDDRVHQQATGAGRAPGRWRRRLLWLPVWLLLAPRDYLSTFMKIGVIAGLAVAIVIVQPRVAAPAFSEFAGGQTGPVWPGSLFPFLFVTIACGALSGFHALILSLIHI